MVDFVNIKSMKIRESGRSTDFISPSFGHGCLYNCTYCYMKRHKPVGLNIALNPETILGEMNSHLIFLGEKNPNQTHKEFWTYDISCNEDFALHLKYHKWQMIFDWFKYNDIGVMGSFATKYVNNELLKYNSLDVDNKPRIRIRFSLMPEKFREILEPNTSKIIDRIKAVDKFIDAGYDVHLNFSPVIVTSESGKLYKNLFELINNNISNKNKKLVKSEVIFLTHNENKHHYNLRNNLPGENLIWNPDIQETKKSNFGQAENIRYNHILKRKMI